MVFLILIGSLGATELLSELVFNNSSYFQTTWWPVLTAFLVAAYLVKIYVGHLKNKSSNDIAHATAFFIGIDKWDKILVGLGILFSLYILF